MLNKNFEGATLFEIDYTPKGTHIMKTVKVWAKKSPGCFQLPDFESHLGKQHEIRVATVNHMK